jgi:pyridoxamine 5'-phosphate oxidase-like protein
MLEGARAMTMQTTIDAKALVDGQATEWGRVEERLAKPEAEQTYWLATVRPDGRPHLVPLLGLWIDGAFFFLSGADTRKGRNLAHDDRCVISGSTRTVPAIDIVLEGRAQRVTDEPSLRRIVDAFATLGWPLEVRDGAVDGPNAPTAGPPPYAVFGLIPATAFGFPGVAGMDQTPADARVTPTRWRFREAG